MSRGLFFLTMMFCSLCGISQDSASLRRENAAAYSQYLSTPEHSIKVATSTLATAINNHNKFIQGESYYILSKAHWTKANYRLSVEYGYKAIHILRTQRDTVLWHKALLSVARNFVDMKEPDQAGLVLKEAEALAKKSHDEILLADGWREYSLLLNQRKLYDSALLVADKALEIFERRGYQRDAAILYSRKARSYFMKRDYQQSIRFNARSIRADRMIGNTRALSVDLCQAAENYFLLNKPDSARIQIHLADSLAQTIGNISLRIRCLEVLAQVLEKGRKQEELLSTYKLLSHLKDALQQQESNRVLAEANAVNNLANKELEIQLLASENIAEKQKVKTHQWANLFLVGGIVLLAIIIILLWRLRRIQAKANQLLSDKNVAIQIQHEKIQAQAENLLQLNQLKSKLFSVISHDLRGPMKNMQVLLDMLTQKVMTPDEFLALSAKLKVDVSINQRTLENLLAWAMSQMEGIKTEPQKIEVNVLIEEVTRLMKEMAGRKGISLKSEIHGSYSVFADYDQVQLIIRNIIHNAIKFSHHDSVIIIATDSDDKFATIRIRDSGVGLSNAEIEILSNSNEYYTKIGTQQEKGTGLGWLLCKEFIRRNGGTFLIRSTLGQGTEIAFTLPLA